MLVGWIDSAQLKRFKRFLDGKGFCLWMALLDNTIFNVKIYIFRAEKAFMLHWITSINAFSRVFGLNKAIWNSHFQRKEIICGLNKAIWNRWNSTWVSYLYHGDIYSKSPCLTHKQYLPPKNARLCSTESAQLMRFQEFSALWIEIAIFTHFSAGGYLWVKWGDLEYPVQ